MRSRSFRQVDVFTHEPYRGNPVAVVLDGEAISAEDMQRFTNWTNLSEATFILPPSPAARLAGADYRVRIFCPNRELAFAGHPTLGTCHAWLAAGGLPSQPVIVQECAVGLIRIRREENLLAFAAPPLQRSGPLPEADVDRIAAGLRIGRNDIVRHAWCDNGPQWRAVLLKSAQQVLAIQPDSAALGGWDVGVIGPHAAGHDAKQEQPEYAFEVRAFFPGCSGMTEDPVTGSLNAALAQWLIPAGLAPAAYVARQGTAVGRDGRVHVSHDGRDVWIGGGSITCIEGHVWL